MQDLIRREDALAILDLAEHDAEERDWRSGANEIARLIQRVRSIPASPEVADAETRGMERAAEICAGLADQVSDAALTGLPEQARLRESMEAAFTKARHAIRAEAAAIRRAAEGEKA